MSNIPLTDLRELRIGNYIRYEDLVTEPKIATLVGMWGNLVFLEYIYENMHGIKDSNDCSSNLNKISGIQLTDDVLLKTNIQKVISFNSKNHIISLEERYEGGYQFELEAIGSGAFKISKPIFYLHELQTAVKVIFDQELTYNY